MYSLKLGGLYIEITSFCNKKCPYCYNDSTQIGQSINKEHIFQIFKECHKFGITQVSISGGEPFAHPNIYEIISKLDELHMKAVIITNLSLLPMEKAIDIIRRGHLFQITLDHPDKDINDITRGKGSYDLVISLMDRLKQQNLIHNIILRYNVSKNNYCQIDDIVELADYYGVKMLDIALLFKSGRGSYYEYVFDYNKDIGIIAFLMKKLKEIEEKYRGIFKCSYTTLNEQRGCVLFGNNELSIGPKIDSNGNVYLCQLFSGKENVLGNITSSSIQDILSSRKAHQVVDKVRQRKCVQDDCYTCGFMDICMCGCPAISYNQTGSLFEKNDQCSMIKFFLKERIKQIGV